MLASDGLPAEANATLDLVDALWCVFLSELREWKLVRSWLRRCFWSGAALVRRTFDGSNLSVFLVWISD